MEVNSYTPVDCQNCNTDNTSAAAFSNNPMNMSDARSLSQQLVQDVLDIVEGSGNRIAESPMEVENITQGLASAIMDQALQRVLNQGGDEESKDSKGGERAEGSSSAGGGGSIFEKIALALGRAMADKANELVELAESVPNAPDGAVLEQSAKVTAAGQELNVLSQTYNSTINSLGSAASTAARKQ